MIMMLVILAAAVGVAVLVLNHESPEPLTAEEILACHTHGLSYREWPAIPADTRRHYLTHTVRTTA